jgi:cell wall-associated NlpC family hydrolase
MMKRKIVAYAASALILAGLLFCALARPARTRADVVVAAALMELGDKYVLAACEPGRAFDCSALVSHCYLKADIALPPLAVSIGYTEKYGRVYDMGRLQRGDIACFDTVQDNDLSDHVGICLGGGYFIHASSVAGKVVITPLSAYADVFSWGIDMQTALRDGARR